MIKLNDYTNKLKLCEAGQTIETRMAYVHKEKDGTYTQLHDTVKCRDYLGDVLHAEEQNKKVSIYGFNWNGKTQKIDRDATRLMVDFRGNCKMMKQFIDNLEIFHEIEKKHNLRKTKVATVANRETTVIVTASNFWLKSIFNISFFTFLIKVCCYKFTDKKNWIVEMTNKKGIDASYVKQTVSVLPFYINNLKKFAYRIPSVSGYVKHVAIDLDTHRVHNSSGFVSMRFFNNTKLVDNKLSTKMRKLWDEYVSV